MAASLGSLVVSLALDAAQFTAGITKSEADARKLAKAIDSGIRTAAALAVTGMAALGAAASAAFVAVNELAKQAGDFQDLAEKTGASAEALASFAIAAKVAGTSVDDLATFSVKLSKNLATAGDEGSKTAKALSAIGISITDFKKLDPAGQIDALSEALAKFSNLGGGKAAVLENIAKGGAQLLPFLKELNDEGGRQVILTEAQIQAADAYADAQSRAKAQLNAYAQVVAIAMLPAITAVTDATKDLIKELVNVDGTGADIANNNTIGTFADNAVVALGKVVDAGQGVQRIFQVIGESIGAQAAIVAARLRGDLAGVKLIEEEIARANEKTLTAPLFSQRIAQRIASRVAVPAGPSLPALKIPDLSNGGGGAKLSDADRYLESLRKQLQVTEDLSATEKALQEIQSGRLKGLTPAIQASILATAREIDANKELKRWIDESAKAFDEQVRERIKSERAQEDAANAIFKEAEAIADSNRATQDEIAVLKGGVGARERVIQQRLDEVIAVKEASLAIAEAAGNRNQEVLALQSQLILLKERKTLLTDKTIAEAIYEQARALQSVKDNISNAFADSFVDFINGSKSAKDAALDFGKAVEQMLLKLAAQKIGESLFGGTSSGGFDFTKLLGSLFGSLGGGGSAPAFAGGTSFAPGGLALVGEQGPELVNLPRGAQVKSASDSRRMMGGDVHITNNFTGRPDTETMNQAAVKASQAVRRAQRFA